MSDKKENNSSGFLTIRNLKDLAVVCLLGVITWKLLNSNIDISIKDISFSDLLSITVSFFAIALSVAFYFKATETSNKFYDNSYSFTKEISEILGRIEAGFGEKLRHIDEGYSGIRDKFDNMPFDAQSANENVEAEKEEIAKKKKEQEELLENLAQRAQLAESEKEEMFESMARTTNELDAAKMDLRKLQRDIIEHKATNASPSITRRVIRYVADRVEGELPKDINRISLSMIREVFSNIQPELHHDAIEDLLTSGLMNSENEISKKGLQLLRTEVMRNMERNKVPESAF